MVIEVFTDWECPNCDHTRQTATAALHAIVHRCRGLAGLIAPLVRAGTKCKIEARFREDYVGAERPQYNDLGQPIMSIVTIRDDGQDCHVLAPVVLGGGQS